MFLLGATVQSLCSEHKGTAPPRSGPTGRPEVHSQFLTRSIRWGILGSNYRRASGKCQRVSVCRVSYLLSKLGFSWNKHRKSFGVFQTDVLGESFGAGLLVTHSMSDVTTAIYPLTAGWFPHPHKRSHCC